MVSPAPQVQVLDKSDYTKQHLVTLENAYPLPQLAAGDIRIQSRIISITTNNFGYARLGHLFGWWNVWPVAPSLPAPYNDTSKYGRISSWGYGEVIESQNPKVLIGTKIFGYLPIGDYPEILQVTVDEKTGHILETSERRATLMHIYNRYLPLPPQTNLIADKLSLGWDSVMRPLFETGYLLNRYAFAWDMAKRTHPLGVSLPWSQDNANLADAVVVLLGASGKAALAFAQQLRYGRPAEHEPRKIVAVGSASSRSFTEGTGLFNNVLLYSDATNPDTITKLGIDASTKVLLANFGGRGTVDEELHALITKVSTNTVVLMIGGDPTGQRSSLGALTEVPGSGVVQCNASGLRDTAMEIEGTATYFENLSYEWTRLKESGSVNGMKLQWGKGMQEFREGWDSLCSGKVEPTLGLVYEV